jgi:hypothetical protein
MKRFLWLGFVLLVYIICCACGDTFRPIIIPNPPTFPNPQAAHTVVSINDNGTVVQGSAMVIDVSGDSVEGVANVGLAPVHAVQQSASVILVANHSVTGAVADSISTLNFSGTTISSTNTISMPPNSAPNFVATTESSQAYVSLPSYVNPSTNLVVPSIGVFNTLSNSLVTVIPLSNNPGANPVAMAETPDTTKLYAANQGLGTGPGAISGFNTVDRSARAISGSLTTPPIWLSARSDSQAVYVLEQGSGTLAWLNTTSTAGPDTLTETSNPMISVPGATVMTYDPNLNRLYIPGGQQMAIVDVSQSPPQYLAGGPIPTCSLAPQSTNCIPAVQPGLRGTGDPCSLTSEVTPLMVVAVAALPDGSRTYVGAYYEDSENNVCPQVTAIDTVSNTVTDSTPVPGFPDATIQYFPGNVPDPNYAPVCAPPTAPAPYRATFRFMMGAAGDSTRAYLSSCDGGNVNIIDTSNDTYILNQPSPISTRAPIPPSLFNPPQNPVFLIAGP